MARAHLGQLLGNVGESTTPAAPRAETAKARMLIEPAAPATADGTPRRRSRVTRATETPTVNPSAVDLAAPAYLRFVRKDTRLREDQQNQLTLQARRLNRAKKNQGARITENSLIRIAVDLLLAQIEHAAGDDEEAIRLSLNGRGR